MTRFVLFASALLAATPAAAGELIGGLYAHAVKTPLSLDADRESGVDVQLGYRFDRIAGTPLQPYVFGALNSKGETSYAAAGLSMKFGHRLFVRPGVGLAIHTGSSAQYQLPDRIAFGSRVLFEPEIGVGYAITPRTSIEASWVHMSHAQLFSHENPGIDNIGLRFGVRF
ncbi:acyloxyacyl hydrolase [Sphingomonas sp. ASV193]|uniref:acyloxyacyl hydrolase n=1 Tax=Sphingomonas sp. ASV193 TaxID=3144405 RepID=UPI0032E86BF0